MQALSSPNFPLSDWFPVVKTKILCFQIQTIYTVNKSTIPMWLNQSKIHDANWVKTTSPRMQWWKARLLSPSRLRLHLPPRLRHDTAIMLSIFCSVPLCFMGLMQLLPTWANEKITDHTTLIPQSLHTLQSYNQLVYFNLQYSIYQVCPTVPCSTTNHSPTNCTAYFKSRPLKWNN